MLEEGMVKSLDDHFNFWDQKVEDINFSADEALQKLNIKHKTYHKQYREFLDNIKELTPNQKRDVKYIEQIEFMLINLFE